MSERPEPKLPRSAQKRRDRMPDVPDHVGVFPSASAIPPPHVRYPSPMGSFPNTKMTAEEARRNMENIEAARESDLSPKYHDGCIGPDCPICANPSHFAGVWKQRRESPEPDVTRNAMSPDELWKMQEKPHVSDDAPDMGPIPGTEGIESDPPESSQDKTESYHPESPLSPLNRRHHTRTHITKLEAERDALRGRIDAALVVLRAGADAEFSRKAIRAALEGE